MIDQALEAKWLKLRNLLKKQFGSKPNLDAVLFIIGMQELGQIREEFSKDEKQDLMHIAVCKITEPEGYFKCTGVDGDGWPLYKKLKAMPEHVELKAQENFLKTRALDYFNSIGYIE
jgi:hypothetical protein